MDRLKKIELIQRSLGLRHKMKVHETMKAPDTHEDFAVMLHSKWELEDELHAIEEILTDDRMRRVAEIREEYLKEIKQDAKDAANDAKEENKNKKPAKK